MNGIQLSLDEFSQGLRDGFAGKDKLRFKQEEIHQVLLAFQQDLQAKRLASLKKTSEQNAEKGSAFLAKNKKQQGVISLQDGLQYKIIQKGKGPKPSLDDVVKCVALLRMRFGRRDPSAPFALARRLYHAAAVRVTGATCTSHTAHRLSHDSTGRHKDFLALAALCRKSPATADYSPSGLRPFHGSQRTVNYEGRLIDGKVFDSSYKRGKPATFPLRQVIQGWQEALQLMPQGSKWRLFVPPQHAYGEFGTGGVIGPNQTLIFDVELIAIGDNKAKQGNTKKDDKTHAKTGKK